MSESNVLATRLREERERLGWSIRKLESRSGVSNSAISLIEKGKRPNPRISTIEKLADALGVSAAYLSGMTNERTASEAVSSVAESPGHYGSFRVLADRLRRLRIRANFSIEDLASKSDVDESVLSHLEEEPIDQVLDVGDIRSLAKTLGTTMSYLIGETDDPTPIRLGSSLHDLDRVRDATSALPETTILHLEGIIRELSQIVDESKRRESKK